MCMENSDGFNHLVSVSLGDKHRTLLFLTTNPICERSKTVHVEDSQGGHARSQRIESETVGVRQ